MIINITLLFSGYAGRGYLLTFFGRREEPSVLAPYMRFISGSRFFSAKAPRSLYYSCLSLIAVYYFVPIGAFSSFIQIRGGVLLMLFFLVLAQIFCLHGLRGYSEKFSRSLEKDQQDLMLKFTMAFLPVCCAFAWFAQTTGIPGDLLGLSAYTAVPLFETANLWGKAGLLFFFMSLAFVSPCGLTRGCEAPEYISLLEVFDGLRASLAPVIITALFVPWNVSGALGLSSASMFAADFAAFWVKVFVMQMAVIPPLRALYRGMQKSLPGWAGSYLFLLFSLVGALCFFANLYL
ncbi:MAG: hypothetical protein RR501_00940 [Cloacibacillus sp.]